MPWKLTVRTGPRVERSRFDALEDALRALELRARELAEDAPHQTVELKLRRYEPRHQVAARLELAGPERRFPSTRAGVDVRGDGSTEAYVGRLRRQVVEPRKRESAVKALRRALVSASASASSARTER